MSTVLTYLPLLGGFRKIILVMLSSMVPFVESRGAVTLGSALHVRWYYAWAASMASYLPVPYLLELHRIDRKRPEKLEKYQPWFDRWGVWALFLVLFLPFTGVGCYLAALLARSLDLEEKKARRVIFLGNACGALLATGCIYGFFAVLGQWLGR